MKHFKEFRAKDVITNIDVNTHLDDADANDADNADKAPPAGQDELLLLMENAFEEEMLALANEEGNEVDGQDFLTGENILPEEELEPGTHSKKALFPVHSAQSFRSHLLLNETYGLLRRPVDRYASTRNLQLISDMVTNTSAPAVSLLFPEMAIFPSMFWNSADQRQLGAVPCHLL